MNEASKITESGGHETGGPNSPSPVLVIENVSKRFGSLIANENISLHLCEGEIVALLGENGAGKTTLMNILFGHYQADQGHIKVFGKKLENHTPNDALERGIGMVHQHFTLADNLSVLDNIILGTESLWLPFSRKSMARKKLQKIMTDAGLSVDMDRPVRELTVGERQRVEILKVLYRNVRILILDEPTAVLTPQEVDDLFELLRQMASQGLGIIIISHKLQEVMAISDRVAVLRQGRLVGNAQTNTVNREQLAEMIVGRQVERPQTTQLQPGKTLLSLSNIVIEDKQNKRRLLDSINLTLSAHQIVGVAGVSGNGQSVLAELLSGLTHPTSGSFSLSGVQQNKPTPNQLTNQGLSRIPEDRHTHGVIGELTLWENLMLDELGKTPVWRMGTFLNREVARQKAASLIESFDIRCTGTEQATGLLSGGNMQKLILARNLSRDPTIILANQPTRGLDEGAIAAVHTLLLDARNKGAGILLITEDLDELLRLSDQVVVMHNGKLSEALTGATAKELGLRMSGAL